MKGISFHQRNCSMSEISNTARTNSAKEAVIKREAFEMRKLNDKVDTDIKTVQEKNVKEVDKIKKDYEIQMQNVKSESEVKLSKVRNSWNKKIDEENKRYEKLLNDLKATQADKFSATQINNE